MAYPQLRPGFSTALDVEDVLSGTGGNQLHVMVADVIKSFDTVDRTILDCVLGRLGLPDWFRWVYFSFHSQVRLRFKLAAGLGEPWCRDGGIPQGCPLSIVFYRCSLCFPGVVILNPCLILSLNSMLIISNVVLLNLGLCLSLLIFTARYVRLVGQDVFSWQMCSS